MPLVSSLRDFLEASRSSSTISATSGELSWLGDSGAAENTQQGATNLADSIPHAISSILGVAGSAFSVGLTLFTLIFLTLFLLIDMERLRGVVRSMLLPDDAERWLEVWEHVTQTGLALGDRRAHDRPDRRHRPGRHGGAARLELRACARASSRGSST